MRRPSLQWKAFVKVWRYKPWGLISSKELILISFRAGFLSEIRIVLSELSDRNSNRADMNIPAKFFSLSQTSAHSDCTNVTTKISHSENNRGAPWSEASANTVSLHNRVLKG